MSIVLYALGAALFVWSGFMLLGGDTFATIDIAASLAGWGAFTVGLGALTGALHRLTRAVTEGRKPQAAAETQADRGRGRDVVPVFVPRGKEPAHFELRAEPALEREPSFEPEPALVADPAPEIEPASEPEPFWAPATELGRRPAVAIVRPPARTEDRDDADTGKKERRARRLQARQDAAEPDAVETPESAAPVLSDRFMPRPSAPAAAVRPALPSQGESVAPAPVVEASPAAIMPVRKPDPDPRPAFVEPAEPLPAAAAQRDPTDDAAKPTAEAAPETPSALAAVAPEPEPKVPEWLARARARREARAALTPVVAPTAASAAPRAVEPEPAPVAPEAADTELTKSPEIHDATPQPAEPQEVEPQEAEVEEAAALEDEPEPADARAAGSDTPQPDRAEADAAEPEISAEPQLVREGEHKGVLYRFYDDGSVEAISRFGVRRFATVDELRETVVAARGGDEFEAAEEEEEPADAPEPAPEEAQPAPDGDALDAALAELEAEPQAAAPELRIDPRDRPARP